MKTKRRLLQALDALTHASFQIANAAAHDSGTGYLARNFEAVETARDVAEALNSIIDLEIKVSSAERAELLSLLQIALLDFEARWPE